MNELHGSFDSNFDQNEIPVTTNPTSQNVWLELPKNVASYSVTSQAILEELRVRHRRLEMYGSAEINPSTLLTIDEIPSVLQKLVQITENHRTTNAISEALRELAGLSPNFPDRVVYFYPFFLKTEEKTLFKVAMVAPQLHEKTDVSSYRRACVKYNLDLIESILQKRSSREVVLDPTHPGKILLGKNDAGKVFLFPAKFGYEAEIDAMVRKAMEPFRPIPLSDFNKDLITYAKETARLVEIIPGYHIILPQGTHQPEYARHLAVQLDALFHFSYPYLKQIAEKEKYQNFFDKLENIKLKFPIETEALIQNGSNLSKNLIELIQEFPFEKFPNSDIQKFAKTVQESILILHKLEERVNTQKHDGTETLIEEWIESFKSKIKENSENTLTLTKIDLNHEVRLLDLKVESQRLNAVNRLVSTLEQEFGCMELKENEIHVLFAIDQRFYSKIAKQTFELSKYDSNYRNELPILDMIKAKLKDRSDPLFDLSEKKNSDIDATVTKEIKSKQKNISLLRKISKRLNLTYTLLLSISLVSFATVTSVLLNKPKLIFYGVPFGIFIGVLFGYIFRKDDPKPKLVEPIESERPEKPNEITKIAEKFIYPKKFNSINEKVYDSKRLRFRIEESLNDICFELKEDFEKIDVNRMIAEIEYAIHQISIIIKIPEALIVKGRSKELIVNRSDFRTVLFRTQLADYYRKEVGLYKNDRDQLDYLQFIIRELEFGYNKYIKS